MMSLPSRATAETTVDEAALSALPTDAAHATPTVARAGEAMIAGFGEVASALRGAGFRHAADASLRLTASTAAHVPLPDPSSLDAGAENALAAMDARLADLITQHAMPLIPSVHAGAGGGPRFVVGARDLSALVAAISVEHGDHGVDAELRIFLDEALRAGDCFLDTAPGLGFAALSAATAGPLVAVLTQHHDLKDGSQLMRAAGASACASKVQAHGAEPLDRLPLPALAGDELFLLHVGDAAQVAPVLRGARGLIQGGRLGTVAWRRRAALGDEATAPHVAVGVLDVLGFEHFALVVGADGVELVPVAAMPDSEMVFSLSPSFLARANGGSVADTLPAAALPRAPRPEHSVEHDATGLFTAVMEDVAPGSQALDAAPTVGELTNAMIEMAWPTARVVSFDIFDTLVVRKVAAPADVFLHLANRAPFDALHLDAADLAFRRQSAESRARQQGHDIRGSGEVTLAEIHVVLAEDIGLSSTHVLAMVRAEQDVELALCEAHPVLQRWFDRARTDGKRLWCISDTYHEAAFLSRLLASCGFALDGVTVVSSADARCSKGEGRLFGHVLKAMREVPSAVLHIGDNPTGDRAMPQSRGIAAILHPWAAATHDDAPASSVGDAVSLGLAMIGAAASEPPAPFWWQFGYSVAGPLLAGYALWLHERFVADGIDRAYFLLRDGEILESVYRVMTEGCGGPTTSLLESSRRAYFLPAYESQRPALLGQLIVSENPRPVGEFLSRYGLEAHQFTRAITEAGFAAASDIVPPFQMDSHRQLGALMTHPSVRDAMKERSRAERRLLMNYLEGERVLSGGRIALVDIGWNATIQRSLVAALELERRPQPIHGYYLGTKPMAHVEQGESTVSGYLFESGRPSSRLNAIMALPQLVEFLCSTTRGSLRRFAWQDGKAVPVHAPVDHSPAQQQRLHEAHTGAIAYAKRLARERQAFGFTQVSPDAALRRLARVIQAPTAVEAQQIGDLQHGDGMGADRSRAFAAFTPGAWSIQDIYRDHTRAYWPVGLAARREPQALVLRTLRWLMENQLA
jgi:predicted HAD superfamily hydrolase